MVTYWVYRWKVEFFERPINALMLSRSSPMVMLRRLEPMMCHILSFRLEHVRRGLRRSRKRSSQVLTSSRSIGREPVPDHCESSSGPSNSLSAMNCLTSFGKPTRMHGASDLLGC
jgi:hypothetical protein